MSGSEQDDGPPVVEVEFALTDTAHPFVGASAAEDCRFELAEMVPRAHGTYAEFFNVVGADPARILEIASAHDVVEASLLREYEDGGLFEFRVGGGCPAVTLAEHGALPREVRSSAGEGHVVAEVPPRYDCSRVIWAFVDEYPDATLECKRERDSLRPMFSNSAFRQVLHERLTDRQREVLETAFEAGYYEWPRECTGSDVAGELGISSSTFSEHIHAAERKLLDVLIDQQR